MPHAALQIAPAGAAHVPHAAFQFAPAAAAAQAALPSRPALPDSLSTAEIIECFLCPVVEGQKEHSQDCLKQTCKECGPRSEGYIKEGCRDLPIKCRQYVKVDVPVVVDGEGEPSKPRTELVLLSLTLGKLQDMLITQSAKYIWHRHVNRRQLAAFTAQAKAVSDSAPGTVVLSLDWAEGMMVLHDNEVMSAHWQHNVVRICVFCLYYVNKDKKYVEETVYIVTDLPDQSSTTTQAAIDLVMMHLKKEVKVTTIHFWSDGCAGQFKGTPAQQQHRYMAIGLEFWVYWYYCCSGHGKGRHDGEGGVWKALLAAVIQNHNPDLTSFVSVLLNTAAQMTEYFNLHHRMPASATSSSVRHLERGKVQRRTCYDIKQKHIDRVLEFVALHDDKHMLCKVLAGVRKMHRFVFSTDGWQAYWSETACGCNSCFLGNFSGCTEKYICPSPEPMRLLKVTREEEQARQVVQQWQEGRPGGVGQVGAMGQGDDSSESEVEDIEVTAGKRKVTKQQLLAYAADQGLKHPDNANRSIKPLARPRLIEMVLAHAQAPLVEPAPLAALPVTGNQDTQQLQGRVHELPAHRVVWGELAIPDANIRTEQNIRAGPGKRISRPNIRLQQ